MNEEEKGIEVPCDNCGRLLNVSPGEYGLTTNYEEYEEEGTKDYLQADIIIGSSANRFVLNMPGIVCNGDCSLELLDTVPDPPGLVCVVEITPAKAASAMMEMQFVNGTDAAVDFFLQLFPTSAEVMDIAAIRLHQEGDKERAYEIIEHGINTVMTPTNYVWNWRHSLGWTMIRNLDWRLCVMCPQMQSATMSSKATCTAQRISGAKLPTVGRWQLKLTQLTR